MILESRVDRRHCVLEYGQYVARSPCITHIYGEVRGEWRLRSKVIVGSRLRRYQLISAP